MRELDLIWVLVPIALYLVGFGIYRLGITVGEDHADLKQFEEGRMFGRAETLDLMMSAPLIGDEVLADLANGVYRCKCHMDPFTDPRDRDDHEAFVDSVGGPEQAARWGEAPW